MVNHAQAIDGDCSFPWTPLDVAEQLLGRLAKDGELPTLEVIHNAPPNTTQQFKLTNNKKEQ